MKITGRIWVAIFVCDLIHQQLTVSIG